MTPQELKNSILQLAIQGKLVEQRAEEGTGAELLEKILAERYGTNETRGTNGTAKTNGTKRRASSVSEVSSVSDVLNVSGVPSDEKPFDIPESWEWVRLGDCTSYAAKKEKVLSADIQPDEWSLDLEDIEKDTGRIIEFRSAKDRRIVGEKVVFHKGQILYSKLRPYLKKILVAPNDGICTPELVPFSALEGIDARYVVVVLKSPHVDFLINSVTYGVKMPRVGTETMINLPIPLPPLSEQKRIVAKIEELMPLVDRYEKAWSRLEDFNKRFPADMQKSLLQLAIQGKLVEQRAEEGTGEELYRQIQVERERLIRNGAVKAEKPFDPISDDEKPFEIPENWTWVRFGNLGSYKKGPFGSALTKSIFVTKGADSVKVYEQKNAIQKDATLGEYYIRRDYFETKMSGFEVHSGDVIVSCAGTIGETYVLPEGIEQGIINQALMRMKIFVPMYVPYFLLFFDVVLKQSARANSKGSAIKNIPPFEILKNYLVPLPPLAEQKRIVAKIEELLPLIDRYEKAWSKFDFKR